MPVDHQDEVREVGRPYLDVRLGLGERRRPVTLQAELARVLPAGGRQHLHQPNRVGRGRDARVEGRLLVDERRHEIRVELVGERVMLNQRPEVEREDHLEHVDRQPRRFLRHVLRIRPLHQDDAPAQVAQLVVHPAECRADERSVAVGALREEQFVAGLLVRPSASSSRIRSAVGGSPAAAGGGATSGALDAGLAPSPWSRVSARRP